MAVIQIRDVREEVYETIYVRTRACGQSGTRSMRCAPRTPARAPRPRPSSRTCEPSAASDCSSTA